MLDFGTRIGTGLALIARDWLIHLYYEHPGTPIWVLRA